MDEQIFNISDHFKTCETGESCIYCNTTWKKPNVTQKTGHLSNKLFSKQYEIKLCSQVPAAVSNAAVARLTAAQIIKNAKRNFNTSVATEMRHTVESRVNQMEMQQLQSSKKSRTIDQQFKLTEFALADQKIANGS